MYRLSRLASTSAVLLTFGLIMGAVTPIVISSSAWAQETQETPLNNTSGQEQEMTPDAEETTPTQTPSPETATNFSDVDSDYWAQPFIQTLAAKNIISGFPDGTFRPGEPVDRAEFAAMIANAFNANATRQLDETGFSDVPGDYWATSAIQEAYETGFLEGYPNNEFQPNQEIPKVQAIVALANGLDLTSADAASVELSTYYTDADAIPEYAIAPVTAATQANLVVNYPNVQQLNPDAPLTRAEAAAHIYQALVQSGQAEPLASNRTASSYIVGSAMGEQPQSFNKQNTENEGEIDVDIEDEDVEVDIQPRLNYIGVGGNIGLGGDSAIGEGSFAVYSKVGLTRNISARPAVAIDDDPTVLLPITYDFDFRTVDPTEGEPVEPFPVAPFVGGGLGIEASDDADVGPLITGGVDVPLGDNVMLTGTANVLFIDDTDIGLMLGVGYRF
jgi:hypothetical protein